MNSNQFVAQSRKDLIDAQVFVECFHEALEEFGLEAFCQTLIEEETAAA